MFSTTSGSTRTLSRFADIKISAILFCAAAAAYSISYYLGSVNTATLFGVSLSALSSALQLGALCLLILKLTMQRNSHVKVIVTLVLIIFCALSLKTNKAHQIIWLAVLCLSVDGVPTGSVVKSFFFASVGILIVVCLCNILGLIPSVYMARGNSFLRNSMGFSHPNNFGQMLFITFAAYAVLVKKDCRLLGIFCALIALLVADSKTSAGGILVFALFSWVLAPPFRFKGHARVLVMLPLLLAFVSFLLPLIWNNGGKALLYQLDNALTNRIFYSAYYFQNYQLHLFGNALTEIVSIPSAAGDYMIETRVMLDNAYCRLLVQYGLVPFIFFIVYYCVALNRTFSAFPLVFIGLLLFSVMGFGECGMIYPACNFFLIVAAGSLRNASSNKSNDDEPVEEELAG